MQDTNTQMSAVMHIISCSFFRSQSEKRNNKKKGKYHYLILHIRALRTSCH